MPPLEHWLRRIALFARRRYRRIFAVALLVVLVAAALATRLRFDTEILNLLPKDDPVVVSFRETLEEFGSLDVLLVAVRIPDGVVVDPYLELADLLAERIEALDTIDYVDYRVGEIDDLIEQFYPKALLFLDAQGREKVAAKLDDAAIRRQVEELRLRLQTPQSLALRDLLLVDPLGLAEVFVDRLDISEAGLKVDWSKGYLLSKDRKLLLLVGKPDGPGQEIQFARKLIDEVHQAVGLALAQWPELAGPDGPPPPTVDLGGTSAITVEDAGTLFQDVTINAVTSMVGVLLLFWIAFRRIGLVLYAFVPLSCGLVLAFGFAGATVGTLNAVTGGFAALLVGLGIDFVIVSYGRYVEERNQGVPLPTALRRMNGSTGRAIVTGGLTTAATFYAFAVTEFRGLRQMGFLIGTGIFFCMASVLVLLPALLAWQEDRRARRHQSERPVLFFKGFGTPYLIRFAFRRPRLVLMLGAAITVVAGIAATRLEFVDSIRSMRPEGNRGMQVQDEIAERFGSGFDYMMLLVRGQSEEEVLHQTALVAERARKLVDQGVLNSVDSVASVLPSPVHQREVIAWLREHSGDLFDVDRIWHTFEGAARQQGLNPEPFLHGIELLAQAASVREPLELDDLTKVLETHRLVERFVRKLDSGWCSVVYLYPPPRVWKREAPPQVEALAQELGVELAGVNVVSKRLREQVKDDAVFAAILGVVVVALMLWVDYRRLDDTLLSLAPLGVGIVWMLGLMALTGLAMNFFNVFVSTMIIGIGVDYGVHMLHRFHEEERAGRDFLPEIEETGKAIVLAALSTSVGFGSLALSHYPGLRSMGLVAIFGAVATALVAITLLPAFLSMTIGRRQKPR